MFPTYVDPHWSPPVAGASRVFAPNFFNAPKSIPKLLHNFSYVSSAKTSKNLLFFLFFILFLPISPFSILFPLILLFQLKITSNNLQKSTQISKKSKIVTFLPLFPLFCPLFSHFSSHTSLLVFVLALAVFNILSKFLISCKADVLNNLGRCRLYGFSMSSPRSRRLGSCK